MDVSEGMAVGLAPAADRPAGERRATPRGGILGRNRLDVGLGIGLGFGLGFGCRFEDLDGSGRTRPAGADPGDRSDAELDLGPPDEALDRCRGVGCVPVGVDDDVPVTGTGTGSCLDHVLEHRTTAEVLGRRPAQRRGVDGADRHQRAGCGCHIGCDVRPEVRVEP